MNSDSGILWCERTVKGVVFDLDGTLTNSIQIYHEVFCEIAARLGIRMTRDELFTPLAEGMNPWRRAFPKEMPNREEKIREFKRVAHPSFAEALKQVRPYPGVDRVLSELHSRGLKIGLVTDSSKASLEPLRSGALTHYFSAMVTIDDGVPKKPEPDGLIECLHRMDIPAENAVFVGDALIDVRAGKEAGTLTIGVLTGLANRRQFEAESPTALVDDVTQVPAVLNLI